MTGRDVLRFQLEGSFNLIRDHLAGITDAEWDARVLPGTSKIGFILWHCARILDWSVYRGIRGVAQLAELPAWSGVNVAGGLAGFGIPDELADAIPGVVSRQQVIEYVEGLREAVLAWFADQSDHDLDAVPDLHGHHATLPDYLEAAPWAEVESLSGMPAWHYLARPCVSHVRVHMGELEVLLAVLRAGAPA